MIDYGYGEGSAAYRLGARVSSVATASRNTGAGYVVQSTVTTTDSHVWYAGAAIAATIVVTDTASGPDTSYRTDYADTPGGTLATASIADGRPRTVAFRSDQNGQVIRRDEADAAPSAGDPHTLWYRFDGREIGALGNDSDADPDYAASIATRMATPGTGAFRGGAATGRAYARFGQAADAITTFAQGSAAGSYAVQAGDTLRSIAATLWGDANLWYKLAAANGLSATQPLGATLSVPGGVIRAANSASTLRPYDPSAILGDTSPTTPAPQAAAAKSKCGVFGQILLVAVAIAVTAVAPFGGGVAASVANGVLGSVVSQSVGVATGIQDKFSFKGVALAGISAGIAAGVGQIAANAAANAGGALGDVGKFLGGTGFGAGAARGALTGTLTQGVAVATGLQAKFDFAGVAAAGVIGGVGDWAAGKLGGAAHHDAGGNAVKATFGNQLGASAASAIAGAAARSLLTGTSFGDNLLATLPDVIGATVGRAIGESLTGGGGPRTTAVAIEAGDIVVAPFPRVVDGLTAGIPWLGEAPGGGAASATGTTAAVTAVSKGDAGQMRTRGGLLEQNGYAPQQSETREQNVAQTSTADAAIRSRIDLSANDKDRLLTELYNRSSYWASVLPAAGALDSIIGGAGSIDLSVGSFDILHASDSRLTLFGPNGLDIDSERFSIGGPNGLFTTSDSLMLGGRSGIVSTNGSISIGGPGGIYAGTNHISIGGAFGLNADSNGIGIGRYSLGFSAEVVGKLGTVGGKGSFASERQLVDHFGRHGADFGSQTPAEYAQQANAFLGGSLGTNALERVRPATGYVVRFNPITDEFGIIRSNGIIRTYYRPNPTVHRYKNNLEYFNAQ